MSLPAAGLPADARSARSLRIAIGYLARAPTRVGARGPPWYDTAPVRAFALLTLLTVVSPATVQTVLRMATRGADY